MQICVTVQQIHVKCMLLIGTLGIRTLDWIADNERSSIILPKGQQGLLISSSTDAIYPEKSFENATQLSMSLCPYRSPRSLGHC